MTIKTNTTEAKKHASQIKEALEGGDYPAGGDNSVTYTNLSAITKCLAQLAKINQLITKLNTATNKDADNINRINQTFVEKDAEVKKVVSGG